MTKVIMLPRLLRSRKRLWPFGKSRCSNRHPVVFFISYENHDEGLIRGVLEPLFEVEFRGHIAQPLYWRQSSVAGDAPWKQIYSWIRECDGVIVLVTSNAVKNPDNVLKEIRYARMFCKPIFPLKDWRLHWEQLGPFKDWKNWFTFKEVELHDAEEPKSLNEFRRRQQVPELTEVFKQILKEHYGHLI